MTSLPAAHRASAVAQPAPRLSTATLRAIGVIWYRDMLRYFRDRTRLAASFAQPVLFLVVFGVGLSSSLGGGFAARTAGVPSSLSYVEFVYPGVVGMAILFTSIFSAMSIVWDREFGFLKEILVAPIDRSAVAVGKALGGATQAMIQGLVMLVLAPVAGVGLSPLTVLELLPLFFIMAFALTAMGVAIAARMRSMQGFQVVMNFLLMPMFFLSGSLFPLANLPGWMTALTRLDPVAYGIAPVRIVALQGAGVSSAVTERLASITLFGWTVPLLGDAALLLGFGGAMLALAIWGFQIRD